MTNLLKELATYLKLNALVRNNVFQVKDASTGSPIGNAFLCEGRLITAAHVIEDPVTADDPEIANLLDHMQVIPDRDVAISNRQYEQRSGFSSADYQIDEGVLVVGYLHRKRFTRKGKTRVAYDGIVYPAMREINTSQSNNIHLPSGLERGMSGAPVLVDILQPRAMAVGVISMISHSNEEFGTFETLAILDSLNTNTQ